MIYIGDASIVVHNLPAVNGYIHVINQVQDDFVYSSGVEAVSHSVLRFFITKTINK